MPRISYFEFSILILLDCRLLLGAQDSRSRHGDQDSGVLVNIDGSMHDGDHDSEDGGREDTFVDAPEELSFSEGRSSDGIGDPLVLIDIAQSNDILQLKRTLEDAVAECLKYKVRF